MKKSLNETMYESFLSSYSYCNTTVLHLNSSKSFTHLAQFTDEEKCKKLLNDLIFIRKQQKNQELSHTEYISYNSVTQEIVSSLNQALDTLLFNFYIIEQLNYNVISLLKEFSFFLNLNNKFKIVLIETFYNYFTNLKLSNNKKLDILEMFSINKRNILNASKIIHNEIDNFKPEDSVSDLKTLVSKYYSYGQSKFKNSFTTIEFDNKTTYYNLYQTNESDFYSEGVKFIIPDAIFPKFKKEFNKAEYESLLQIAGDNDLIEEIITNYNLQCYIILKDLPIINDVFKEIKNRNLLSEFIDIYAPLFSYIILNANEFHSEVKSIVNYLYKNNKKLLTQIIPIIYFSAIKCNSNNITKIIPATILNEFDHSLLVHKVDTINYLYKTFFLTDKITNMILSENLPIDKIVISENDVFIKESNTLLNMFPLYQFSLDTKLDVNPPFSTSLHYCSVYSVINAIENDELNNNPLFKVMKITGRRDGEYFTKRCNEADMCEVERHIKNHLYEYSNNQILSPLGNIYDGIKVTFNGEKCDSNFTQENFKVNTKILFEETLSIRNKANTDTQLLFTKFALKNNIYYPKNENGLNFFKSINNIIDFECNLICTNRYDNTLRGFPDRGLPIIILEPNIIELEDVLNYLLFKTNVKFEPLQKMLQTVFPEYTFTCLNHFLVNILYLAINDINLNYMYSNFSSLCKEFANNIKNDFIKNNSYKLIVNPENHNITDKPVLIKLFQILKLLNVQLPEESKRVIQLLNNYNKKENTDEYYRHYVYGNYKSDRDTELSFILLNQSLFYNLNLNDTYKRISSSTDRINNFSHNDIPDEGYLTSRMISDLFWSSRRYAKTNEKSFFINIDRLSQKIMFNIINNTKLKSKTNFLNMHILLSMTSVNYNASIKDHAIRPLLDLIKESGTNNEYITCYYNALVYQINELGLYKVKEYKIFDLFNSAINTTITKKDIKQSVLYNVLKKHNTGLIKMLIK